MKTLISCIRIRHLGTFSAFLVMLVTVLFSSSTPINAASKTRQTFVNQERITGQDTQEKSPRRWIQIDLSEQNLKAWEGKKLVYLMRVSTGKRTKATRTGKYFIQSKLRSTRMRGTDYNIADVPYTMYYSGSYAIHGAYWHNRFGTPVSRGCVNLPVQNARKLYNWSKLGTLVVVDK
jgi:lipoprotein-anchoring transpeptidase ErfK/SrfK